jgi:6-phosphogluconolactonase
MRGRHLYFASCVKDGGIVHYVLQDDGSLLFKGNYPCDRPMYLLATPGTLSVLLRQPFSDSSESGLFSYKVDSEGCLCSPSSVISTEGEVACHLCAFGRWTYVANYISGSLFSTKGSVVTHTGHGINPKRQEHAHVHMVTPSPDGNYLLSTDLGLDRVFVYDEDLHEISNVSAPAGSGPRHLCVVDSSHVACANELSCTVSIYGYNDGFLSLQDTISLYDEPQDGATAAAIRERDGNLYVSVRGTDEIAVLHQEHGVWKKLQMVSCGGKSPRDIVLVGNCLLSMNETSSTVTEFVLAHDGCLKRLGGEEHIPGVLCAVEGN